MPLGVVGVNMLGFYNFTFIEISAIRPELASRRVEHILPYSDITIFIFDIKYVLPMLVVYRF